MRREPEAIQIRIFQGGQTAFFDLPEGMLEVAGAVAPQDEWIRARLELALRMKAGNEGGGS